MKKSFYKFRIKNIEKLLLAVLIIIFAAVGSYLFIFSHAATTLTADFNSDSVVNVTDLSILATNWGRTTATHAQGDANSDGTINIYDLSILASQWGQTITPTPTAVNVINYGATGNGTTDDTAAIGRALSAAVSSTKTV